MKRNHYSEYASHAMRFYARNQHMRGQMTFTSEADMLNWNCCLKTLLQFDPDEREILLEIYKERDTFPDNVRAASVKRGLEQDMVWNIADRFIVTFAKNRGLI